MSSFKTPSCFLGFFWRETPWLWCLYSITVLTTLSRRRGTPCPRNLDNFRFPSLPLDSFFGLVRPEIWLIVVVHRPVFVPLTFSGDTPGCIFSDGFRLSSCPFGGLWVYTSSRLVCKLNELRTRFDLDCYESSRVDV